MTTLDSDSLRASREAMVDQQLVCRGIQDAVVLRAMREVPRHVFVNPEDRGRAYGDHPLLIGHGQTISQPYMVARMVELCHIGHDSRVLEVGAGSGYQSAVLAAICKHVFAAEIIAELAHRAQAALSTAQFANTTVSQRDGSEGWPEQAPFDAIVVAAGAPAVPAPLVDQLAEGARLVIPVGVGREYQVLQIHERRGGVIHHESDTACRFVDLQGRHGW